MGRKTPFTVECQPISTKEMIEVKNIEVANQHHVPLSITLVTFWPTACNLSVPIRKQQQTLLERHSYKVTGP